MGTLRSENSINSNTKDTFVANFMLQELRSTAQAEQKNQDGKNI